jgi:hypothetical protein
MNVRPSTRRKALLGLYRIRRKRKGGRLTARELDRAWHPTTGLRRADLQLALVDAVEQKLLESHETAAGLVLELTWLGEQALQRAFGRERLTDLPDWITLLRARLRRSKRAWAGPRRSGDVAT